eukprot:gnl/TRDRNA2_/TRDRNA2_204390_c0_seq1.p2 gnl/TRDRNA2_/TRDRNA2_204390_c0~~gnl/TRDRNA2_/TRDRNA2_204390_c0_seq1.p2  ORF type:complete len:174 (+),score=14.97 gnl/TRDRNA2_/TRDRNA2_204390_c0_seq1:87-608(+)
MGFAWACIGFLVGGGLATAAVFQGLSVWPPQGEEGSCQVNKGAATWECMGTSVKVYMLSSANVTLEDGTKRTCNTFWLTDGCYWANTPPEEVLNGASRPCQLFEHEINIAGAGTAPAGACVEPGHVGYNIFNSMVMFIGAPIVFCCCFCGGIIRSIGDESTDEHPEDESSLLH